MNPLFEKFGQQQNPQIQRLQQFMRSFRGNPRDQIQQLLNSGRVSQQQYDAAVKKANDLAKIIGM